MAIVSSKKKPQRRVRPAWILGGLVVIVLCAVISIVSRGTKEAAPAEEPGKVAVEAQPVVLPPPIAPLATEPDEPPPDEPPEPEAEQPQEKTAKPKRPVSKKQEELQKNYVYPTPGQARLDSGHIITFKPPEEGHVVRFFKEGKFYWCYPDGTFEAMERKPIFDDPFEEQLVGLSTPGATFVPSVLLNHSEEELREMLSREVVISEDDSEDVVQKKMAVAEMKKILYDYLQEGGTYQDFIREMHQYSQEERSLKAKGMAKVYDLIDNGDLDAARDFVETYNEILGENNFNPLSLPRKVAAQLYGDGGAAKSAH